MAVGIYKKRYQRKNSYWQQRVKKQNDFFTLCHNLEWTSEQFYVKIETYSVVSEKSVNLEL